MKKIKDFSLRERKAAQTKVELLKSMLQKTITRKLEDITVKELCEDAMISEATFFNYFPKKTDLIVYFVSMWTIEVNYLSEKKYGNKSGLKRIEYILDSVANETCIGNSRIMSEIIYYLIMHLNPNANWEVPVSEVEVLTLFLNHPKLDPTPITTEYLIMKNLKIAVEIGELPPKLDFFKAFIGVLTVFFGAYVTVGNAQPDLLPKVYKQQLDILWQSLKK